MQQFIEQLLVELDGNILSAQKRQQIADEELPERVDRLVAGVTVFFRTQKGIDESRLKYDRVRSDGFRCIRNLLRDCLSLSEIVGEEVVKVCSVPSYRRNDLR